MKFNGILPYNDASFGPLDTYSSPCILFRLNYTIFQLFFTYTIKFNSRIL
jgi:hypothetical protein